MPFAVETISATLRPLPLTDVQRTALTGAIDLVLNHPSFFTDTVKWLEFEYSDKAYRRRFHAHWQRKWEEEERKLRSAPSIETVLNWPGGYAACTSSYVCETDTDGSQVYRFDEQRDKALRDAARNASPEKYESCTATMAVWLARHLKNTVDSRFVGKKDRLELAIRDITDAPVETGGRRVEFHKKIVLLAALSCWPDAMSEFGEFGQWQWDADYSIGDLLYSESDLSNAGLTTPASEGREEVLFFKDNPLGLEMRPNGNLTDKWLVRIENAVEIMRVTLQLSPSVQTETHRRTGKLIAPAGGQTGIDPLLSDRQRFILRAMLELKAFDSDSLQSTSEIAKRAESAGANPELLKEAIADLQKKGLIGTKVGRGGGCWLTEDGRLRAEKL